MRLVTFGKLELQGYEAKVSALQLLLLTYMRLEQQLSKGHLARVFWPHLAGQLSKKGERKDLNNVSVNMASFKRELGLDADAILQLECDACEFERAFELAEFEQACELFDKKGFLFAVEDNARLTLSSELELWLKNKREQYLSMALDALLALARKDETRQHEYALKAFDLLHDELEPKRYCDVLTLLEESSSAAKQLRIDLASLLRLRCEAGLLSEEAMELFLMLHLQPKLNLAAIRGAANLSPAGLTLSLTELTEAKLIDADNKVLTGVIAEVCLRKEPALHLKLLAKLREHSPVKEAFGLYHQTYKLTQGFGGAGFWIKAKEAYLHEAKLLTEKDDFEGVIRVLKEFCEAEHLNQKQPDEQIHVRYANTLGVLSRYSEILDILEPFEDSVEVLTVKMAAFQRLGNREFAEAAAYKVLNLATNADLWSKTMASNLLGINAFSKGQLQEADEWLAKAEMYACLYGERFNARNIIMMRARVFARMGQLDKAKMMLDSLLGESELASQKSLILTAIGDFYAGLTDYQDYAEAEPFFRQAYELAKAENLEISNPGRYAMVLNDWTYAAWKTRAIPTTIAESYFQQARKLSEANSDYKILARIQANIAIILEDASKFETALNSMLEAGNSQEYEAFLPDYKKLLSQKFEQAKKQGKKLELGFYEDKLSKLESLLIKDDLYPVR